MDINEYALEQLVRERLSTLRQAAHHRALAARQHALATSAAPGPGLRARLGGALIVAGEWLQAGAEDPAQAPHA